MISVKCTCIINFFLNCVFFEIHFACVFKESCFLFMFMLHKFCLCWERRKRRKCTESIDQALTKIPFLQRVFHCICATNYRSPRILRRQSVPRRNVTYFSLLASWCNLCERSTTEAKNDPVSDELRYRHSSRK